jgi:tRNA A58 N-methylase Trm61
MSDPLLKAYGVVTSVYTASIIRMFVKLKISESLISSPKSAEELSFGTNLNPDRLHYFLLFLETQGYFSFDSETKKWSNTAESLIFADPVYSPVILAMLDPHVLENLLNIEELACSDKSGFELRGLGDFSSSIKNVPGMVEKFHVYMQTFASYFSEEIVEKVNLVNCQKVLDVGGGNGTLAIKLSLKYPIEFGVFELPEVAELASRNIEEKNLTERIKVHIGDFFVGVTEGYDSMFMRGITNGWSDDDCIRILKNCRKSLSPGNKLIIVDFMNSKENLYYNLQTLCNLFVISLYGTKVRTKEVFQRMLEASGFVVEEWTQIKFFTIIQSIAV